MSHWLSPSVHVVARASRDACASAFTACTNTLAIQFSAGRGVACEKSRHDSLSILHDVKNVKVSTALADTPPSVFQVSEPAGSPSDSQSLSGKPIELEPVSKHAAIRQRRLMRHMSRDPAVSSGTCPASPSKPAGFVRSTKSLPDLSTLQTPSPSHSAKREEP